MFKSSRANLAALFIIASTLGACGGDGVDLGGGNSGSEGGVPKEAGTAVALLNLYHSTVELLPYYSYLPNLFNHIGEKDKGLAFYTSSTSTIFSEDIWKEVDSYPVYFAVNDANSNQPLGKAGSTFDIPARKFSLITTYGSDRSDEGLRFMHVPFLDSKPANDKVNVRLANTYSSESFEGPVDFYLTPEDGGNLVLVAASVEVGEISSVITINAHPDGNKLALLPAGYDYPSDPLNEDNWLFYNDATDGHRLNGGSNYVIYPVNVGAPTIPTQPENESRFLYPLFEFVIEAK
ncbi:hypothetical protein AHAT_31030 [Agarivorans sp. Toyoura001]|uniref:hypothetical protein n=1 Tax=Agarivorans sp. Toyoura001 TaxID=2283141 RepID=UPI0010EF9C1C|nr:hypothetical protein [Agarivorans sp. Toyoura001]GDY27213.1 hypothetical protein AHAT_31030 [Agarivorans sp. Toyoura001]